VDNDRLTGLRYFLRMVSFKCLPVGWVRSMNETFHWSKKAELVLPPQDLPVIPDVTDELAETCHTR
jgi:hypothetical protein